MHIQKMSTHWVVQGMDLVQVAEEREVRDWEAEVVAMDLACTSYHMHHNQIESD
jgi:hypothetical protein